MEKGSWLVLFTYSILEYWIGRTKLVSANSFWEVLFFVIKKAFYKKLENKK